MCQTVQIYVRDSRLFSFERQEKLAEPVCVSTKIAETAFKIFKENVKEPYAIRSLGVRACDLMMDAYRQMALLPESVKLQKQEDLETAVDAIRRRFGHFAIQRGLMLTDKTLSKLNPKDDHVIHPVAFMR